jgi:DNA oxidative demethylase
MLFNECEPVLPEGFQYLPDWISQSEEPTLLEYIARLSFSDVRMHGVVAKRRVVHFGWDYGYESWRISRTDAVPDWLMPLRARAAVLIEQPAEALEEVLISRYEPGAGIGWHRDAPMFGPAVVGVSLLGTCRMRFQCKRGAERKTAECLLAPRSAYVLCGAARKDWQHSIPPAKELRYSITFRTVKGQTRGL